MAKAAGLWSVRWWVILTITGGGAVLLGILTLCGVFVHKNSGPADMYLGKIGKKSNISVSSK